jgi:hypothetical protein
MVLGVPDATRRIPPAHWWPSTAWPAASTDRSEQGPARAAVRSGSDRTSGGEGRGPGSVGG